MLLVLLLNFAFFSKADIVVMATDPIEHLLTQQECRGPTLGCLRVRGKDWRESTRQPNELCKCAKKKCPPCEKMAKQSSIQCIVIHHSGISNASEVKTPEKIAQDLYDFATEDIENRKGLHKTTVWGDVPYHFIIDRYGNITEGRSLNFQPDSNTDFNRQGVANIVVEGDYNLFSKNKAGKQISGDRMNWGTSESLATVIKAIKQKYETEKKPVYVITHKKIAEDYCRHRCKNKDQCDLCSEKTDCPGPDIERALQDDDIVLSSSCPNGKK